MPGRGLLALVIMSRNSVHFEAARNQFVTRWLSDIPASSRKQYTFQVV